MSLFSIPTLAMLRPGAFPALLLGAAALSACSPRFHNLDAYLDQLNAELAHVEPPSFAAFDSGSPSQSLAPRVQGSLSGNAIDVDLYSDSFCLDAVGQGSKGDFESVGVVIAVDPDTTTKVYGRAKDAQGNLSGCVHLANYQSDNQAPTLSIDSPVAASVVNASGASSFTLSGSCSEVGRSVAISNAMAGSATCLSGGTWSVMLDLSSLPEGDFTLEADLDDAAGNVAIQASRTFRLDTQPPSSHSITISGGAAYSSSSSVTLTLAATEAAEMYITNTATCSGGGSWQAYATSSAWTLPSANASNTVYVMYRDSAGNESSCVDDSIIHDSIAPAVAITSPAAGSNVTSANVSSFAVSGTCSENGRSISISGAAAATVTCASGAWSATLDLSSASQGSITIQADHEDAAGNDADPASLNLEKDTQGPTANSIVIAGGAAAVSSSSVTLTLGSTDADQMYVTNTPGCGSDGSWENYGTSKSWTLPSSNASNTVYAKFRDSLGNESSCVNDSINHDSVNPSLAITTPESGSYIGASNQASFAVGGTCSEEGRAISITGAATGTATCTSGAWSQNLDFTSASSGTILIYADHDDAAGNDASQASLSLEKDVTAPSSHSVVINNDDAYTNSTAVTLTLAATDASEMYVTNTAGCGSGGNWTAYSTSRSHTLGQTDGIARVYVKFRDQALNESSCVSDSITHDGVGPTTPGALTLGTVPSNLTETPTIAWTGSTDSGSGISHYEVRLRRTSGSTVVVSWVAHASGDALGSLSLTGSTQYHFQVRAVDLAGNASTIAQSANWTTPADPSVCTGVMVGGYCWHQSANDVQSCTQVCSSRGGVHAATRYYSGSHGTDGACKTVMDALGYAYSTGSTGTMHAGGCAQGSYAYRRGNKTTDFGVGANEGWNLTIGCACMHGSAAEAAPSELTTPSVDGATSSIIGLRWSRGGAGVMDFRIAYGTGATAPANCDSAQIPEGNFPNGFSGTGQASYAITGLLPGTTYSFRICASDAKATPALSPGVSITATTNALDSSAVARAPTYGNLSSAVPGQLQTVRYSHTVSGSDPFMVVGISSRQDLPTVNSVTYGGSSLTRIGRQSVGRWTELELWYLTSPPAGAADVEIQFGSVPPKPVHSSATTFNGVHQVTPFSVFHEDAEGLSPYFDAFKSGSSYDELLVGHGIFYYSGAQVSNEYTVHHDHYNWANYKVWTLPGEPTVRLKWQDESKWSVILLSLKPSAP